MKVFNSLAASIITFLMTFFLGSLVYGTRLITIPFSTFANYLYFFGWFTAAVVFVVNLVMEVKEVSPDIRATALVKGVMIYGNGKEQAFVTGKNPEIRSIETGQSDIVTSEITNNIWLLDDTIDGDKGISCLVETTERLYIYKFNQYSISFNQEEE